MVCGYIMKDKNGTKQIKYGCDYYDHFTEYEGWVCNICGDDLPQDERDLQEHMLDKHGQDVRYSSKEFCDKYDR